MFVSKVINKKQNVSFLSGFEQFVESTNTITEVISKSGSVLGFLQNCAPAENSPLSVAPEVLDNYVKSVGECALALRLTDRF